MDALYLPDGDGFVGTELTQGGWHPTHQHGGPVQALLVRALEQVPTLAPMRITRLTFDMVRPVPIGPRISIGTEIIREGKKIQVVEGTLHHDGTVLVRVRALRLRVEDTSHRPTVPAATSPDRPIPPWDAFEPVYRDLPHSPGFLRGIQMRRFPVAGTEGVFGYWIHLDVPLVAGEEPTPLQRFAVAGDFTNTIGVMVEATSFSSINPDLNLHVLREPVGGWIAVVGDSRFDLGAGIGISDAELHDEQGLCAVGSTCQLLQLR